MDKDLEILAIEIDSATTDRKLSVLINRCNEKLQGAEGENRPILFFLIANCYAGLSSLKSDNHDYIWSWQQDEHVLEILNLRRAVSDLFFTDLDLVLQCKIITNIAGVLSLLGRPVEAINMWNASLSIIPNFAMALGNKGIGLIYYARSLYDYGHEGILVSHANENLKKSLSEGALWDSGLHPEVEESFKQYLDSSENFLKKVEFNYEHDLDQWPLGTNEDEVNYRGWCLHHRLSLTPLNDVCRYTAAARDIIHLPSHVYKTGEVPRFSNYYNLLKQEYVTARYILFEAIKNDSSHISDIDVMLLDGFDGVRFGYRNEQLKISYRLAYSLFDKISLFLNDYFEVGIKAGAVNFRNIWGRRKNKKFELYPCFESSQNWSLRGLYYLSKDLFDEEFLDVALPDAKELSSLRNRTEHRFLSIQEYDALMANTEEHSYIARDDFEEKVYKILSMAREALIYLSLAMHCEEQIRENDRGNELLFSFQSAPIIGEE